MRGPARRVGPSALLMSVALTAGAQDSFAGRAAESFADAEGGEHAVRATLGLDPAVGVGVGYVGSLGVELGGLRRRLAVHADLGTIPGFSSWSLGAGASVLLAEGPGLNALATAGVDLEWSNNEVHRAAIFGYRLSLRPGWYDPIWYATAELGLRHAVGADIEHTDAYRAQLPEARDGAYALGAVHLDVGAAVGFRIAQRWLVGLRFAWRFHGTLETYAPYVLPYRGGLEVGMQF